MNRPARFLRVAEARDFARVAALAGEIWREHYVPIIGSAQVEYMLEHFQSAEAVAQQVSDGLEYFLLEHEARLEGYLAFRPESDGSLFLSKLYVRKAVRGTGLGRACVEFVEREGRARGLKALWLTANKRNPALAAYQKLGFTVAADVVTDIGSGFVMDDFRMEKQL